MDLSSFDLSIFFQVQADPIYLPRRSELKSTAAKIIEMSQFLGIVGAVDGCHIVSHPKAEKEMAYRNYKKFHSFVLMAIVNADRTFSYIFTGYPGSSHDSYIFKRARFILS